MAAFDRVAPSGIPTEGNTAATVSASRPRTSDAEFSETEASWSLWLRPGRARAEFALGTETMTVVVAGDRWWSSSPTLGTRSGTNSQIGLGPGLVLVEWRRLPSLSENLSIIGRRRVAGRDGLAVQLVPLGGVFADEVEEHALDGMAVVSVGPASSELGIGADSYHLVVDLEYGVLLRTEARLDGEVFRVCEVEEMSADTSANVQIATPSGPEWGTRE